MGQLSTNTTNTIQVTNENVQNLKTSRVINRECGEYKNLNKEINKSIIRMRIDLPNFITKLVKDTIKNNKNMEPEIKYLYRKKLKIIKLKTK